MSPPCESVPMYGATDARGQPTAGATFIVEGVIYEPGTFARFGTGRGLLADGTSEFPSRVIGRWTCRGTFTHGGIALLEVL